MRVGGLAVGPLRSILCSVVYAWSWSWTPPHPNTGTKRARDQNDSSGRDLRAIAYLIRKCGNLLDLVVVCRAGGFNRVKQLKYRVQEQENTLGLWDVISHNLLP